jgi:hypothetical protein
MVAAYNDVLDVTCKYCGITYQILANRQDVHDWLSGSGYIQDILAYLSAGERELLISGMCNNCWKIFYPKVDNDEE